MLAGLALLAALARLAAPVLLVVLRTHETTSW
jgi:hypothetical protein